MNDAIWTRRPYDPAHVQQLRDQGGYHPLVARLLAARQIDTLEAAAAFLQPRLATLHDPATLPGCAAAAGKILAAVRAGKTIAVFGDYDVDGVTATTLLWSFLMKLNAVAVYRVPHRERDGYGLSVKAVQELAALGAQVIVTVDCGITGVEPAAAAAECGVELIVTDHHQFAATLPAATLVHPRLPGSTYGCGDLCGCGVAWKLACEIAMQAGSGRKAPPELRAFLLESLQLVALATIADVVPLRGENRVLVRTGLDAATARPLPGLRALLDVAGLYPGEPVTAETVGFQVGPRINAAGRMDDARHAVALLTMTADQKEAAAALAETLNQHNLRRREIEQEILAEAHQMAAAQGELAPSGALVLGRTGWPAGVVGIVASRLVESYGRPAIVLAHDEGKVHGSARSVRGFDLVAAIAACAEGLSGYGGHAAAAGLRMPPEAFPAFAAAFDDHCRSVLTAEMLRREVLIDVEVPLRLVDEHMLGLLDQLEPYGQGNPRPVLAARDCRLVQDPKPVGEAKTHVQIKVEQQGVVRKGIGFGMAPRFATLKQGDRIDVAFQPGRNAWNGRVDVQLQLKDVRHAS